MSVDGITGFGFATGYDGEMSVRDMAEIMRQAEQKGFTLGFFSETIELMRDSVTALTAMALATKRMMLGSTQTVRLRNPLLSAQTLASLDEVMKGRLFISPGACTNTHADRYGMSKEHPPTALRETIEVLRGLLRGDSVTFHGDVIEVEGAKLGWAPLRGRIPMFVPATSTTGLQLAGAIADGVVLNAVSSPEYSANAIRILQKSVLEAGRSWEDFSVLQIVNVSVEDTHQAALDAIRWEVASKFDPIQLPFIVGPKVRVGEPYIKLEHVEMFKEAWERGGRDALIAAVPDSYIEGMTASGTPNEVRASVERYRDAGVQVPILRPAAKHQSRRIIEMFAS